jgi:hypothetical protein
MIKTKEIFVSSPTISGKTLDIAGPNKAAAIMAILKFSNNKNNRYFWN